MYSLCMRTTIDLGDASGDFTEIDEITHAGPAVIIRRSVKLYALAVKAIRDGGAVYIKSSPDAELERLHFL